MKVQMKYLAVNRVGNCLAVQWLGLFALTAKDPGSIPGQGTKIEAKKQKEHTHTKTQLIGYVLTSYIYF